MANNEKGPNMMTLNDTTPAWDPETRKWTELPAGRYIVVRSGMILGGEAVVEIEPENALHSYYVRGW